jgi:hypothetical protein
MDSMRGSEGFGDREIFRDSFTAIGVNVGLGGSASVRMLEKDIGSAGLLGFYGIELVLSFFLINKSYVR